MKVKFLLILLFLPLAIYGYQAEVVKVSDGDTIHVRYQGEKLKIRLYGIDCPELAQEHGQTARQQLSHKIMGRTVGIKPLGTDQYERILAQVYLGGENINVWLLQQGHAWVYTGYCKKDFCIDWYMIEKKARDSHLGLWSNDSPQAPWIYRRQTKNPRPVKKEQPTDKEDKPLLALLIIFALALSILPVLRRGLLKNYIRRKLLKKKKY